jgi:hypothetical protein
MKKRLFGVAISVFATNVFAATAVMEDPDFTHSALKQFSNFAVGDRDVIQRFHPIIVQEAVKSEPDPKIRAQRIRMSEIHRITQETYSDLESLSPLDFMEIHPLIVEMTILRSFSIDLHFSKANTQKEVSELLSLFWTRVDVLTRWFHKMSQELGQDDQIQKEYLDRATFSSGFVRHKDQVHTPESAYELIVKYLEGIKDPKPRDDAYIQACQTVKQAKIIAKNVGIMSLIEDEVTAVKDAAIALDQQRVDEGIKKIDELIKQSLKDETAQQ